MGLSTGCVFIFFTFISCTEASIAEPFICYILDGILLIYCIVATAFFFREKFYHDLNKVQDPTNHLTSHAESEYEELNPDPHSDPSKRKRRQKVTDPTYQTLQKTGDPYEVIEMKGRVKKSKTKRRETNEHIGQQPSAPPSN